MRHFYVSTACWHEINDDRPELHASCRASCKFAEGEPEYCRCPNHPENDGSSAPPQWVDQARSAFTRLLLAAQRAGVNLAHEDPDLHHDLLYDPYMFWARGEVQPAGEWHPTNTNKETP